MASPDAPDGRSTRRAIPNLWELNEVAQRLVLLPFVLAPRAVGQLAADALAAWVLRPGGWARRAGLRRVPPQLPARTGQSAWEILRANERALMYERILLLRQIAFPSWRRRVGVLGLRHVRTALDGGRGLILWVNPCVASNVAPKQAVATGMAPVVHLSRPSHPFSGGPFGVRYLNPILRRPEMPFMAERVEIEDDRTMPALRRLRRALKANQPVSITVTPQAARTLGHPFLGGTITLPAGPVELAASSGASLLPVFTWGAKQRDHVVIGPPLPVAGTGEGSVRATHQAMLDWLEPLVVAHPDAWIGWRSRQFTTAPPP